MFILFVHICEVLYPDVLQRRRSVMNTGGPTWHDIGRARGKSNFLTAHSISWAI